MLYEHLKPYRDHELRQVMTVWPAQPGARVLEVGAGAGWQAKALANHGFVVEAIDIGGSAYAAHRARDVKEYDGRHLPYPDASFDVVYSSHVLVEAEDLDGLQAEMWRVLKLGGAAVHVLPSATIRAWNNLAHYLYVLKLLVGYLTPWSQDARTDANRMVERTKGYSLLEKLGKVLVPHRLSPRGNVVTQIYGFSRFAWCRRFRRAGWVVRAQRATRVFHTGYLLLDTAVSLPVRELLSHVLGSASRIYVLERPVSEPGISGGPVRS